MNTNGSSVLTEIEKDYESACQTLRCPNCGAKPRARCRSGELHGRAQKPATSHTGRYLAAVRARLVPPFAGGWRG